MQMLPRQPLPAHPSVCVYLSSQSCYDIGMIPMASGMGEQVNNRLLGRAVIGGLAASTLAALFVLPPGFAWVQKVQATVALTIAQNNHSDNGKDNIT